MTPQQKVILLLTVRLLALVTNYIVTQSIYEKKKLIPRLQATQDELEEAVKFMD